MTPAVIGADYPVSSSQEKSEELRGSGDDEENS